jgi:hypothetical protein
MGLLDDFSEFAKTPGGQGLLSAAFGGLAGARRGAPLNSLGNAGLAGLQGYAGAQDRLTQQGEAEQTRKLRQMQIDQHTKAMEEQQSMKDMASKFAIPAQQGMGATPGNPDLGIMPMGERAPIAAGFDYEGYAKALATRNPIAALDLQSKLVKQGPKFSTAPQYDQAGRAFLLAEDGSMKYLDGVKARDKLNEVRLGDKVGFRTDYSPEIQGSLPIGQSPDSKASNALGWANYGISKQRETREASNQDRPVWNESLGGFVDPKKRIVLPAMDSTGKVIEGAGPKMTEDQAKASGWLAQAENAYKNMRMATKQNPDAAKPGFNDALAAIPSMGATTGIANMFRGEARQSYMQGASSMSEALLRAATGAGVNKDEALQKVRELTPQIGDSDAVIAQKEAAIPIYIESLKMRAGPGAKRVQSIMGNNGGASGDFGSSSDPLGLFRK